jgi:hypothetical protein
VKCKIHRYLSLPPFSLPNPRLILPRNQITIRYRNLMSHTPCPRSNTEGKNPDSSLPPAHDAPRIFPKFARIRGRGCIVSAGLIQLTGRVCAHCRLGGYGVAVLERGVLEAELKCLKGVMMGSFWEIEGKEGCKVAIQLTSISTEAWRDSYLQQRSSSPARVEHRRSLIQYRIAFAVSVY